jgi:membrane protein YdbS with pleckstrin-like domain
LVQKNAAASWLYWIKGIPGSLALGIVAMIMMVFHVTLGLCKTRTRFRCC